LKTKAISIILVFVFLTAHSYTGAIPQTHASAAAPSAWAAEEVGEAIAHGLVPSELRSDYASPISRGDFCKTAVTFIEVKSGKPVEQILGERGLTVNKGAFSDTNDPDILAASTLGIVNGRGNGKFAPQESITRQEAATLLTRIVDALSLDLYSNLREAELFGGGIDAAWNLTTTMKFPIGRMKAWNTSPAARITKMKIQCR
jgi:hypothetical protein